MVCSLVETESRQLLKFSNSNGSSGGDGGNSEGEEEGKRGEFQSPSTPSVPAKTRERGHGACVQKTRASKVFVQGQKMGITF